MENEQKTKKKTKLLVAVLVAAITVLIAVLLYRSLSTSSIGEDEHSSSWLMLGYDAARTNYNLADKMESSLKELKVINLEKEVVDEETGTTIFAADEDRIYSIIYPRSMEEKEAKTKLCAIEIKSGKKQWEFSKSMLGVGAMDEKNMYCISAGSGKVFAVKLSNGKKVWEKRLVKEATGKQLYIPVVRGGTVYVIAEDARLFALDTKTGKKRWSYSELPLVGSAAVSRGLVFCLTEDNRVLALDAESGKQEWLVGAPGWEALLNPSVGKNKVYIVDRNEDDATDTVIALDSKSGNLEWQFIMKKNTLINSMCMSEDSLFIAIGIPENAKPDNKSQGEILAINAEDGKKEWRQKVWGMPALVIGAGNTLFVSSTRTWRTEVAKRLQFEGGRILALSTKSGKVAKEYKIVEEKTTEKNLGLQPPMLISDGKLFAQNVPEKTIHVLGR